MNQHSATVPVAGCLLISQPARVQHTLYPFTRSHVGSLLFFFFFLKGRSVTKQLSEPQVILTGQLVTKSVTFKISTEKMNVLINSNFKFSE